MSERQFYVLRYVSILAVVFSFVGSVLMFVMGSVKTLKAVKGYASTTGFGDAALGENLTAADQATIYLLRSMDLFLFGLVLLIFSIGVYNIFIASPEQVKSAKTPSWMRLSDFNHLKTHVLRLIIVMLAVITVEKIFTDPELGWELLIVPVSTVLLAFGLKILNECAD